ASFRYILAAKLLRSDTLLVDVVTRPATTAGLAAGASRARPWTLRTARRLRIWLSKATRWLASAKLRRTGRSSIYPNKLANALRRVRQECSQTMVYIGIS